MAVRICESSCHGQDMQKRNVFYFLSCDFTVINEAFPCSHNCYLAGEFPAAAQTKLTLLFVGVFSVAGYVFCTFPRRRRHSPFTIILVLHFENYV